MNLCYSYSWFSIDLYDSVQGNLKNQIKLWSKCHVCGRCWHDKRMPWIKAFGDYFKEYSHEFWNKFCLDSIGHILITSVVFLHGR